MDGAARNTMARLHPKSVVKNPNVKLPQSAPIEATEPTQLTCTLDNGPVTVSGVSSDINVGRAGANQPMHKPLANCIRFAKKRKYPIKWFVSKLHR